MKKITFGPVEIGLSAVLLLVIGIVGYQFADIKDDSADTLANSEQQTEANQVEEVKTAEEESEEVKIPAEESTEPKKVEEVAQDKPKPDEQTAPNTQQLSVTVQAGQSGSVVSASSRISQPINGVCQFMFKKDGYKEVVKEVSITNSTSCDTSVAATSFGATGEWKVYAIIRDNNYAKKGYSTTTVNVKF